MLTNENEEIVLDLNNSNVSHRLIKTTGKSEYVMPIAVTPTLRLTALSDASSFYGGNDLAEFALSGSLQYELAIPANLTLHTNMEYVTLLSNKTNS